MGESIWVETAEGHSKLARGIWEDLSLSQLPQLWGGNLKNSSKDAWRIALEYMEAALTFHKKCHHCRVLNQGERWSNFLSERNTQLQVGNQLQDQKGQQGVHTRGYCDGKMKLLIPSIPVIYWHSPLYRRVRKFSAGYEEHVCAWWDVENMSVFPASQRNHTAVLCQVL